MRLAAEHAFVYDFSREGYWGAVVVVVTVAVRITGSGWGRLVSDQMMHMTPITIIAIPTFFTKEALRCKGRRVP